MIVLALESAAEGCSAALLDGDGTRLAFCSERMERGQDARLIPLVQEAVAQAGLTLQDVDRIALTRGPGSFTGVRIALAAAQGLGLALEKPVLAFDRFRLYREAFSASGRPHLIVFESKREELYFQRVAASGKADDPAMLPPAALLPFLQVPDLLLTGDAVRFFEENKTILPTPLPDAEVLLCGRLALKADPEDPTLFPRPLYLRAPDVTLPKAPSCQKGEP